MGTFITLVIIAGIGYLAYRTIKNMTPGQKISFKKSFKEAREDITDLFSSERSNVESNLETTKQKIDNQTSYLKEQWETSTEEGKKIINEQLNRLQEWRYEIGNKVAETRKTFDKDWKEFRSNAESTVKRVNNSFNDLFSSKSKDDK